MWLLEGPLPCLNSYSVFYSSSYWLTEILQNIQDLCVYTSPIGVIVFIMQ
jgi:hypothetical protein